MFSGVGIICFTGSYLVALGLEAARFFWKSPIRHVFVLCAVFAGFVAHSAFLYYHQIALESGKIVSGTAGFFLIAAWGLACVYLYLGCTQSKIPFGLIFLPLILISVFVGAYPVSGTHEISSVGWVWRMIHGLSVLAATLSVLISFIAGVMFLEQQRRVKKKIGQNAILKLPSLEWTQTAARHGIGFSTLMLGVGIFSGILLNHLILVHEERAVSPTDPLVFGALVLFVFLVAFLGTLTFYRPLQEGRRIAVLTVLSFLFLASILLYSLTLGQAHWG